MRGTLSKTLILILAIGVLSGCSTYRNRNRESADRGGAPASHPIDDAALTSKVKAKILSNDMLNGLKIDVDSQDGVVYLSGVVDSTEQKKRAVEITQNTEGVRRVEDNLKVGRLEGSSSKKRGAPKRALSFEDIG